MQKNRRSRAKRWAMVLLVVLTVSLSGFFIYVSQDYKAEESVVAAIQADETVRYRDNYVVIPSASQSESALVFYPGGKVDALAYYPLLHKMSQSGITCIVVNMPFQLAVFNASAFDDVADDFSEVTQWFIGGHSLGGAMASSYASDHQDRISGLILLGAYIYGDYPVDKTITVYGSEDEVLNRSKITYTENVFVIDGGNHAQFGNYGPQKGDGTATISSEEQQNITTQLMVEFMGR